MPPSRETQPELLLPIADEDLTLPPSLLTRVRTLALTAPVPARIGNIRAGTAGWTDPSLIRCGRFYPRGVSDAEARLRYYASQFPMVEVDATYYALPNVDTVQAWADRTPETFVFDVKAHASLTGHPLQLKTLPRPILDLLPAAMKRRGSVLATELPSDALESLWQHFLAALQPLRTAHKMGALLLQFPPWFTATRGSVRVLEHCRQRLGDWPAAIEFRHPSWGEPSRFGRVIETLKELQFSFVCVDEPQGTEASMPPLVAVADRRLSVVRFHGRRADVWAKKGVSVQQKFDHLYTPEELQPWVSRIQNLSSESDEVHAVFNNCVTDKAVLGAKDLSAMLVQGVAV